MIYSRYRNDSNPQASAHFLKKEWVNGAQTVNSDSVVAKLPSSSRQCYDTVDTDFHKRSKQGEIFNNEFLSVHTTFSSGGDYSFKSQWQHPTIPGQSSKADWSSSNGYVHTALFQNVSDTVVMQDALDLQRAQIAALGSVNKTDFDLGTFVGEWSKTKSLHRDLGNALLKLFTEGERLVVKRGKIKKVPLYDEIGRPVLNRAGKPIYRYLHDADEVAGTLASQRTKNAANLWLVGRYGVMPLVSDLQSAFKYMCKNYNERQTARGFSFSVGQSSRTARWSNSIGYYDNVVNTTRTLTTRVGILYDTDAASRALAGIGLTRPLSTAWELASYSFVFDWFFNVGAWLDAMQPAGFSRNLSAWVSTTEVLAYTTQSGPFVRTVTDAAGVSTSSSLSDWSAKTITTKKRYPWVPSLPTFPALGQGFTSMRSADFAALVLQKIKTRL